MKLKEKYIQFAIDSQYNKWGFCDSQNYWVEGTEYRKRFNRIDKNIWTINIVSDSFNEECPDRGYIHHYEFIELITSKPFIEAIVLGLEKKLKWASIKEYYYDNKGNKYDSIEEIIDDITYKQSIAIRDNELEDFITNLLDLGNAK